jgi:hypothetical protein
MPYAQYAISRNGFGMTESGSGMHRPGMRVRLAALLLSLLAALLPRLAFAQCSGTGGVPFNCATGSTPQAADYVMGGSASGENTVKWTWSQVLGSSAPAIVSLFASPPAIGGTAPNTAAFTTVLVGNGTTTGLPYQFQSAINFDPSTIGSPGYARETSFGTTLNYSTTTTNIWEGVISAITVNGPGTATGEINEFHASIVINSGADAGSMEGYEASTLNYGTTGTWVGNLVIPQNQTTGSVGTYYGAKYQLSNANATAGAINLWSAIDIEPVTGGGSTPTGDYAIINRDSSASMVSLGSMSLGTLSKPSTISANTLLNIAGLDNSAGTYSIVAKSLAGTSLFYVVNNGLAFLGGASFDGSGNITNGAAYIRYGGASNDPVMGSGINAPSLSVTAGFLHLPFTNSTSGSGGIPTGTPATGEGPACIWNDVTFVLDCYSPGAAAWKHVTFSANAG